MAKDSVKYNFFYFGNSDWSSLPNREHHIAFNLAKNGHNVFFIEEMPSIAKKNRIIFSNTKENIPYYTEIPANLKIIKPSTIPTFFRSSLTPKLDQKIFLNWFKEEIKFSIKSPSVAIISTPVWFYLFKEEIECFDFVVYDLYDDLNVSARNKRALRYLKECEKIAVQKSNLIICSAPSLQKYIEIQYGLNSVLIRNAVDESIITENYTPVTKKIIGLVGAFKESNYIYDFQLIGKVADSFPDYEIRIIGNVSREQLKYLLKYRNINCAGYCSSQKLREHLNEFSVCIIPFLSTEVVRAINPLKMYEYLAFGRPVVATDNFDYGDAKDLLFLSNDHDEFIQNIGNAIRSDKHEINIRSINYIKNKNWNNHVDQIVGLINSQMNKNILQTLKY